MLRRVLKKEYTISSIPVLKINKVDLTALIEVVSF